MLNLIKVDVLSVIIWRCMIFIFFILVFPLAAFAESQFERYDHFMIPAIERESQLEESLVRPCRYKERRSHRRLKWLPLAGLQSAWQKELQMKVARQEPPSWMLEQIREDLLPFSSLEPSYHKIVDDMMQKAQAIGFSGLFVCCRIFNNQVFFTGDCGQTSQHPRFFFMFNSLSDLCKTVAVPNVCFIFTLDDVGSDYDFIVPLFSYAKTRSVKEGVLIPDFEALHTGFVSSLLNQVQQGIIKYPWEKKKSKAYWRGSTTGGECSLGKFLQMPRAHAVTLSLENPLLVDARFNVLVQCCSNPEELLGKFSDYFGNSQSIEGQLEYKYQLLIDGNSCAYSRAYWQLFSNAAILKQSSPHIQWYYRALQPYVHYIPLNEHLTDLIEKIEWAQEHEEEVEMMVNRTQQFAKANLSQADVFYYLYLTLLEYSKLQK